MASSITVPTKQAVRTSSTAPPPRHRRRSWAPVFLVAPAVILLVAFLLVPIGYSVYLSVFAKRVQGDGLLGPRVDVFVGLDNYVNALTDPTFWQSMGRMLAYGLIVVPIMFVLALLFALLLDLPRVRLRKTARALIFLPYAVPGVIASLLWGFIYLPDISPITQTLNWFGMNAPNFLVSPTLIFSVANIAIWGGVGFNMIVLYTSLRSIPAELYDAARIDGCSEFQIAWRIKIPLLTPALGMTMIFALIAMIQVYNEPQALTAITSTITSSWVPMMKIYTDAFVLNNVNAAAALSVIVAVLTFGVSMAVLTFVRKHSEATLS